MKTKAQYEAANANYWVGCGGTINKGRSVQAGAVGAALSPVRALQGLPPPPPMSPGLPEGSRKGPGLLPRAWPSRRPILNLISTIQCKARLLSTYWVPDTVFHTRPHWLLLCLEAGGKEGASLEPDTPGSNLRSGAIYSGTLSSLTLGFLI